MCFPRSCKRKRKQPQNEFYLLVKDAGVPFVRIVGVPCEENQVSGMFPFNVCECMYKILVTCHLSVLKYK